MTNGNDNGKPEGDFADDEATQAFDGDVPTHAQRPAPELPLPGDLPPEELTEVVERSPFDESDAGNPLSDPHREEAAADEDAPPAGEPAPADGAPGYLSPRLESILESLLFVADKPIGLKALAELVGEAELAHVKAAVEAVEERYRARGIQLHAVAGGWQFRTNPENAVWVQKLLQSKPVRLSRAQLETLAIAAYRQPITRPEIDQIRGVDSGGTLKTLMDRSLVRILGKKEEPGRPMLYGTTKEFLEFFNLHDLKDLPTLREFHELTEEHKAQVAALESAAPEGSVETEEEARAAEVMHKPLERMELTPSIDDAKELEEIDRLIATATVNVPEAPAPPTAGPAAAGPGPENKPE